MREEWVARYAGLANFENYARAIAVDAQRNIYVTGFTCIRIALDPDTGQTTCGSLDYGTVKYDADGNQLWVAGYGGPTDYSDATALALDGNGNVYVTGVTLSGGAAYNDYATVKYDPAGNHLWAARYNGPEDRVDYATAIAVDGSGNAYVTGWSDGSTYADYATIKYDSNGNQLWVARYDGPGNATDLANAIALDVTGNVHVTGSSCNAGPFPDCLDYATVKYDANGNQLWVARYDGLASGVDRANAIALDGTGNVYVTGSSDGLGTGSDFATVKYDANGNQLWVARYDGLANGVDVANALALDVTGNVYVTGSSEGLGTGPDFATVKYDTDGNQLWVARYNGPGNGADRATAIALDGAGNVYVTGGSDGVGSGSDYATVKYDANGNQLWVARYNGPGNGVDVASAIALDGSSNVYVTGGSCGGGPYAKCLDYATVKYSQE